MKLTRKMLALLLAVLMLVSMVPVSVFADDSDTSGEPAPEQVQEQLQNQPEDSVPPEEDDAPSDEPEDDEKSEEETGNGQPPFASDGPAPEQTQNQREDFEPIGLKDINPAVLVSFGLDSNSIDSSANICGIYTMGNDKVHFAASGTVTMPMTEGVMLFFFKSDAELTDTPVVSFSVKDTEGQDSDLIEMAEINVLPAVDYIGIENSYLCECLFNAEAEGTFNITAMVGDCAINSCTLTFSGSVPETSPFDLLGIYELPSDFQELLGIDVSNVIDDKSVFLLRAPDGELLPANDGYTIPVPSSDDSYVLCCFMWAEEMPEESPDISFRITDENGEAVDGADVVDPYCEAFAVMGEPMEAFLEQYPLLENTYYIDGSLILPAAGNYTVTLCADDLPMDSFTVTAANYVPYPYTAEDLSAYGVDTTNMRGTVDMMMTSPCYTKLLPGSYNTYNIPVFSPTENNTSNVYNLEFSYLSYNKTTPDGESGPKVTIEIDGSSCVCLTNGEAVWDECFQDRGTHYYIPVSTSIKAVSEGTSVITAKVGDAVVGSCTVVVRAADNTDEYITDNQGGNGFLVMEGEEICTPSAVYTFTKGTTKTCIFGYFTLNGAVALTPTIVSSNEDVIAPPTDGPQLMMSFPAGFDEDDLTINMYYYMCLVTPEAAGTTTLSAYITLDDKTTIKLASADIIVVDPNASVLTEEYFPNSRLLTALREKFPEGLTIAGAAEITELNLSNNGDPIHLNLSQSDIDGLLSRFTGLHNITLADSGSQEGDANPKLTMVYLDAFAGIDFVTLDFPQMKALDTSEAVQLNIQTLTINSENVVSVGSLHNLTLILKENGNICGINNKYPSTVISPSRQYSSVEVSPENKIIDMKEIVGEENLSKIAWLYINYDNYWIQSEDTVGNESWTYDPQTGILTITDGYMKDFIYGYSVRYATSAASGGNVYIIDNCFEVEVSISYEGNILSEKYLHPYLLQIEQIKKLDYMTAQDAAEVEFLVLDEASYINYCQENSLDYETNPVWKLKGLEYFTGLKSIEIITENTTLDISSLENLPALVFDYVGEPTSDINLKVSAATTTIMVMGNVTGIGFVPETVQQLHIYSCHYLTDLDVSGYDDLVVLEVGDCGNLTSFIPNNSHLKNLTVVGCRNLTALDLTGCTGLTGTVNCQKNALESLTLCQCSATSVNAGNEQNIGYNKLTSIVRNGYVGAISAEYQRYKCTAVNNLVDIKELFGLSDLSAVSNVTVNGKPVADYSSGKIFVGSDDKASFSLTLDGAKISGSLQLKHETTSMIVFSVSSVRTALGENVRLYPVLNTKEYGYSDIIWSSSDETVVSVTGSTLHTLKEGTCTVTATVGSDSAQCSVTVVALKSITLSPSTLSFDMTVNEDTWGKTVTAVLDPADYPGSLSWDISGGCAYYKSGSNSNEIIVVPANDGSGTVTVCTGGLEATCDYTVSRPISFPQSSIQLYVGGKSKTIEYTLSPEYEGATVNFSISWFYSTTEPCISIDGNIVTPLAEGSDKISVYVHKEGVGSYSTYLSAYVGKASIWVGNYAHRSLFVGDNPGESCYPTPSDATVAWTSSDESVVTVDNSGRMTAVGAGTATVTAFLPEYTGVSKSIDVTVRAAEARGDIINSSNFRDEAFREKLEILYLNSALTTDGAKAVKSLDLSGCGIKDFAGLEFFTGLETLNVSGNGYTALDLGLYATALSSLTTLTADQSVETNVFRYVVEMKKLLQGGDEGKTVDLTKVSVAPEVGSYDPTTGHLTLTGTPESFVYTYATGLGTMSVSVTVNDVMPKLPDIFRWTPSENFVLFARMPDYGEYTYQWQVSTDGGDTFTNISNYSGSNTYSPGVNREMHGNRYRCVITSNNTGAEAATNATELRITNLLENISFLLTSYYGEAGDAVRMAVEATGSGVTYQWYKKPASASAFVAMEGETSSELAFTLTAANSGAKYYCVITDADGSRQTNEVTAAIGSGTVITDDGVMAEDGDTITIDPGLESVVVRTCHFQWEKCTDGVTYQTVDGAASPVLTTSISTSDHGTIYRLKIWDDDNNTVYSQDFVISIKGKPVRFAKVPSEIHCDSSFDSNDKIVLAAGEGLVYTCACYFPDKTTKFYETSEIGKYLGASYVRYTVTDAKGNVVTSDFIPLIRDGFDSTFFSRRLGTDDIVCALDGEIRETVSVRGFAAPCWQLSTDGETWTDISAEYYTETNYDNKYYSNREPFFVTESTLTLPVSADLDGSQLRCVFKDAGGSEAVSNAPVIRLTQEEHAHGIALDIAGHPTVKLSYPNAISYAVAGTQMELVLPSEYSYSAVTIEGVSVSLDGRKITFIMPDHAIRIEALTTEQSGKITFQSRNYDYPLYAALIIDSGSPVSYSENTYGLYVDAGSSLKMRLYSSSSSHVIRNVYIWAIDGTGDHLLTYTIENGYYCFTMPQGNVRVEVEFLRPNVNVTVLNPEHGTVVCNTQSVYGNPSLIEYYIYTLPDDGYEVDYFLLNGAQVPPTDNNHYHGYTAENITVSAVFKPAQYTIRKSVSPSGSGFAKIMINGIESTSVQPKAYAGDSVVVHLTPSVNYKVSGLIGPGGTTRLAPTVFAFTMPADGVTIYAQFEKNTWDGICGTPTVTVPKSLQEVVSATLDDDHNLTVSITGETASAWADACGAEDSGFITVNASFAATPGTTQTKGGYRNSVLTAENLGSFAGNSAAASAAAEGDTVSYELKIAAYRRNSNGTITIVPFSDVTAEDMRGVYQLYGDAAGTDTGAAFFNFFLDPQVLHAFTVTPGAGAEAPAAERITWLTGEALAHTYTNGKVTITPADSTQFVNDVTVASAENNVWSICTVKAPEGFTASEVTDSANEGLSGCFGDIVTIRKPVAPPYTLNDVAPATIYSITWTNGTETIEEQFTLSVTGTVLFQKYWTAASVLTADLADSGIYVNYDTDTGRFHADVTGTTPPTLEALNTLVEVAIPNGATKYRKLIGYSDELYDSSFADTQKTLLDTKNVLSITEDTKLGLPLFEVRENTLGGVRYAYSGNLGMRFALYEFYDDLGTKVGSAYLVGESGSFIFGETTEGVVSLDELEVGAVTAPTIVGSTGSLKVMYYPQQTEGTAYMLDIEPVEETEGTVTVYLPYSLTGKTYEELKGKTITVYHYPDENDTSIIEELEGECTEYGIKIEMSSFSPIVIDWSRFQNYVVAIQSRLEGTEESFANITGGGVISIHTGTKVSAPYIEGYKFVGWYSGYEASSKGTKLSASRSFTYVPNSDTTLTAVYRCDSSRFNLEINASKFTITGSDEYNSTGTFSYNALDYITVNFCDENVNFLYWANESGKIVSKSKAYSFLLGSNMKLHAVYDETQTGNDRAFVVFLSSFNQVLQAQSYTSDDTISFPDNPSMLGFTFERWVFADDAASEATEAQIKQRLSTSDTITVVPAFTRNPETYILTVNSVSGETPIGTKTYNDVPCGDVFRVSAENVEGYVFLHWEMNGEVLSYAASFNFRSSTDAVITAVYGTEEAEETAILRITEVTPSMNGSKYRLSFTEYFYVPSGCTMTSAGFVMTTDPTKANTDNLVLGAEGIKTYEMDGTYKYGTYTMHLNTTDSSKIIYMRGYMQYLDADEQVVTLYSDIVGESYNILSNKNH